MSLILLSLHSCCVVGTHHGDVFTDLNVVFVILNVTLFVVEEDTSRLAMMTTHDSLPNVMCTTIKIF